MIQPVLYSQRLHIRYSNIWTSAIMWMVQILHASYVVKDDLTLRPALLLCHRQHLLHHKPALDHATATQPRTHLSTTRMLPPNYQQHNQHPGPNATTLVEIPAIAMLVKF